MAGNQPRLAKKPETRNHLPLNGRQAVDGEPFASFDLGRAAHEAGMRVIAIPNRRYPPPPEALALADVTLNSLDALAEELI